MKKTRLLVAAVLIGVLLYACNKEKKDNSTPPSGDAFKKGMLVNYADTLILPAYSDLQVKLAALEVAANAFLDAPSSATHATLTQDFRNAYISFQGISAFYFGPASALLLNNTLNTFPAGRSLIESGIQSGTYDLTLSASDSIQGFPALDYLLFEPGVFTNFAIPNPHSGSRRAYVKAVITRMKLQVAAAMNQWNDGYRNTFVSSLKTDVGSSIGSLVNQFAFEMDALKGPRIGWPFGKQSNGIVFADKCEAYYSGITKDLAIANLTNLKKYFMGGAGTGIDDYLVLLGKQQLSADVLAQFDVALGALQAIPGPMSAAFSGSPATVETAYREVQKLLTLIKTDVASATAVQIAYMDNDGD